MPNYPTRLEGASVPREFTPNPPASWGPPQGGDPEADAERANPWDLIRRNIRLIGACTVLAGAAAAVVTARLPRVYEASASIRIDEKSSQLPALDALKLSGGNALATELEMLRSRSLAEQVVDSFALQLQVLNPRGVPSRAIFSRASIARTASPGQYRLVPSAAGRFDVVDSAGQVRVQSVAPGGRLEFGGIALQLAPSAAEQGAVEFAVLPFDETVDAFLSAIDVTRRNRDAAIVDLRYRSSDPELARDAVNALALRFISDRQDARQSEARSTVRFLRDQVDRVSERLATSERALRTFREREHVISLPDEASTGVSRRADLQAQRSAMDAERQALQQLLDRARTGGGAAGDPSRYRELLAFPTLLRSSAASGLVTSLTAAEDRRNELLSRRTPQDPDVKALDERIAQHHRDIQSLVATYLQGLTNQVAALDLVLARSDARLESIPRKEIQLAELERNAKGTEAIYSMLQTRLKESEIAAAVTDASVRLVDAAVLPQMPVAPNPLLNIALALAAGAMLGLSGAFIRERTDRSLHTRRELLALTGVPVLGLVPRLRAKRNWSHALMARAPRLPSLPADGKSVAVRETGRRGVGSSGHHSGAAYGTDDLFAFLEAHARIATNLAFLRAEPPLRVLTVTSALPGDGKTTVATNLALALAREGKRVLLIDADLRGGRVSSALGTPPEPGLSEFLTGRAELPQVLTRVAVGRGYELHAVARGAGVDAPAQLLGSNRARELLDWARATYDSVIVDTPPVNSVADAALLAPLTDGIVVVARAGGTAREAVAFAVEQLRIVRAPIVGAVLNEVDLRRDQAYGYAYYGRAYASAPP